ncbi:MAG: hypothetical protein KBI41_14035, partial [Kiritimatiellae bacterium]|nr:hypothetical protein [Kiritimatiellia bacterium]
MKREIGLTVCVALAAGMAFGATVTTNGAGAVTIDVPADETYVYPAPLANDITSVTKTGAGIVKFSQAASGCSVRSTFRAAMRISPFPTLTARVPSTWRAVRRWSSRTPLRGNRP